MDAMGFRGIIWSSQPLCHKLLLRHRVWRSSRTQGGMRWGKMNSNSRHFESGKFDWRLELRAFGIPQILVGALVAAMAGPITFTEVRAETQIAIAPHREGAAAAVSEPKPPEQPKPDPATIEAPKAIGEPASSFRAAVRAMVEQEARNTGLPADIADAVVHVESNYDPAVIGGVGEIGLMQIRPATPPLLGFRRSPQDLPKPETNIHYRGPSRT